MGLPKLAELVSHVLPDAVSRVSCLEEQLASRGLTVETVNSSVSSHFDEVYQRITGVTTLSNSYMAGIHVDLEGAVCLSDGQIKPTVEFSELERIGVQLLFRGELFVTLLAGAESPYKTPPEFHIKRQHLRWRNYGDGKTETINFLVIPENESRAPPLLHIFKAYSLDEAEGLETVDNRVLAVHRMVGREFFYCVVQRDEDGAPRYHYLTLNPRSKGDSFKNGVDALCRIIDSYPSLMGEELQPRQAAAVV